MTTPTFRPGDTVGFAGGGELHGQLLKRERWPSRALGDAPDYRWFVRLCLADPDAYLWTREEYLRPAESEATP